MKIRIVISSIVFLSYFLNAMLAFAQKSKSPFTPSQQKAIKEVSLKDYASFKNSVKPLINEMSTKQIIGLGEGTHGTAEFYKVRYWITRILIEEKGFNHVAFENDLTETWMFNEQLATTTDLNALMKQYMLSLWQNEETKELIQWVKDYNTKHDKKVSINGIDYPVQKPDILMLRQLLSKTQNTSLLPAIESMSVAADLQDEAWFGMNKKDYKLDWQTLSPMVKKGYVTADSVETELKKMEIEPILKSNLLLAIGNLKQGFEPFYKRTPEGARDSIMAYNTAQLIKSTTDKVVIWAHNAHLGKTGIYNNAVGGTGGYILKLFPNNYFVLGTGTAIGKFGGTTDARAVNTSPILPYQLENPIKGSWEEFLSSSQAANFYFNTAALNVANEKKPLRFIGYGIKSGKTTYDSSNLSDLFDAFLFLKQTNEPTSLR